MIEQINKYRQNVIFKIDDSLFLNSKNIIIKRSCKKLNNKKFNLFEIIALIDLFYKLELSKIIRIFNVFHSNLLILIIINSLSNQKNSLSSLILVNNLKKQIINDILDFKKFKERLKYRIK